MIGGSIWISKGKVNSAYALEEKPGGAGFVSIVSDLSVARYATAKEVRLAG